MVIVGRAVMQLHYTRQQIKCFLLLSPKVVERQHSLTCSLDVAKQEPLRYSMLFCPLTYNLYTLSLFPQGKVLVNGLPIEQIKDWYIANTGYILQLATSYYEELTVRENLTLAAQIKLPSTFTLRDKFTRIEQVLAVVSTCTCNIVCRSSCEIFTMAYSSREIFTMAYSSREIFTMVYSLWFHTCFL